jgi:hypothetical protein
MPVEHDPLHQRFFVLPGAYEACLIGAAGRGA